jgi:acid phosphatase family membrane protein YuiD
MEVFDQGTNDSFGYKGIWVPLVAWFVAQSVKVIISFARTRKLDFSLFYSPGGMPSAHSALMTSLATTIGVLYGLNSPLFAISAVVAFIVMYDAAGVRRTVGYQSTVLNKMLDELFRENKEFSHRLQEIIGHTNWEVFAGALLGVALGFLCTWPW